MTSSFSTHAGAILCFLLLLSGCALAPPKSDWLDNAPETSQNDSSQGASDDGDLSNVGHSGHSGHR